MKEENKLRRPLKGLFQRVETINPIKHNEIFNKKTKYKKNNE